jgi:hypothetical protein
VALHRAVPALSSFFEFRERSTAVEEQAPWCRTTAILKIIEASLLSNFQRELLQERERELTRQRRDEELEKQKETHNDAGTNDAKQSTGSFVFLAAGANLFMLHPSRI